MVQHPLHLLQVFTYKMQEDDDLVDHVNKVKVLTNQFVCLEVPERDEDIVIILLKHLLTSYKYLIKALKAIKDLMMDYVMTCLMHEMSKHKEKKPQGEDAHGIMTKQKLKIIFTPRRKVVLSLQQFISCYVFLL